jgi:hypothetical protein
VAATRLAAALLVLLAATHARAQETRVGVDTIFYSDTDRVIVVSPQVTVSAPVAGGQVTARATVDVVSAASVDVVSQATPGFSETRYAGSLAATKRFGAWRPGLSASYSWEPDYRSLGLGGAVERRLGGADTTGRLGVDVLLDTVGQVDTPDEAFSEGLETHAVDASLTQVLGPRTVLRGTYTLTLQRGYLEKPYRFVPMFDQAGLDAAATAGDPLDLDTFDRYRLPERPPENVPDLRVRHALAARLLRYLPGLDASLRLDYRFYVDSWSMQAHTLELGFRWAVGEELTLGAANRVHWQSSVSFWQRTYVLPGPDALPEWRTIDRDLSAQLADTAHVSVEWQRGGWRAYVDVAGMFVRFDDFLLLDERTALIVQAGVRWTP